MSVARGKGGGMFVKAGRDQQLYNYQEAVRDELKRQQAELLFLQPGDDGYELAFYFHHVLEAYQTASGRTARDKESDLTNLVKATEDALQGIVIDNDKNVIKQTNYLQRSPVAEGTRYPVPYVIVGVARYLGHDPNELPMEVWDRVDQMVQEDRARNNIEIVRLPDQDVF
jgi:hypothetical protein